MAGRLPLFWFWFKTVDDARTGTRRAAYTGFASALLTTAFIVWSLVDPGAGLSGLVDAWSFIDVAATLALSYGTYRGSRIAAVGLLGFYVVNQILLRVETGSGNGLVLLAVFGALFAQGVAGAFTLHRLQEDPDLADQLAALESGEPSGPAGP